MSGKTDADVLNLVNLGKNKEINEYMGLNTFLADIEPENYS